MTATAGGWAKKSTTDRAFILSWLLGLILLVQVGPVADATDSPPDPLALSPEIKSWVHAAVPAGGKPKLRLHRLMDELGRLGLQEASGPSPTAIEVFETRKADCVGYAHLFVALARELDLPVYFVLSQRPEGDQRNGDYLTFIAHMAAGRGSESRPTIYDFGGESAPAPGSFQRISDRTAAAVLFSNRGVDQLFMGRPDAAAQRLRLATRLDPELTTAWTNLGVALRQLGDSTGAEAAYRRAIATDPKSLPAWRNLAILLSRTPR